MMTMTSHSATAIEVVAAVIFPCALLHTFATKYFEKLDDRYPRHAGLFHLLGEVEVVFGFWAGILIIFMALTSDGKQAVDYVESRQYTEPLFVFVVMVVAASRPVLEVIRAAMTSIARIIPLRTTMAKVWLGLAAVPLFGSLITEPAAITLAALMLAPLVFRPGMPEWLKYGALGVFFLEFTQAYESYQSPLILKEGLLVGFFLAGLVVLGGMQQWWLQPIVSSLEPAALFFAPLTMTAITDNAALTYLGSLIEAISDQAKYMLVAGAVAGGGLTVIANAPNPAGVALLCKGFEDQSIGAGGLLVGAILPTIVAAGMFLI